jgi:hypothetical protein
LVAAAAVISSDRRTGKAQTVTNQTALPVGIAIDGVQDLQDLRTLRVIESERLLIQSAESDDERLVRAGD